MLEAYFGHTFILVLVLSLAPLGAGSFVGFIVSFLQAATQIQEQSISFLVKFITVAVLLLFGSTYAARELVSFTRDMLESLPYLGGM